MLAKTQNVALRWITGAFCTTPIAWMELVAGIPPVKHKANYMIRNALQRASRLPTTHILNRMAAAPVDRRQPTTLRAQDNIWMIKEAVAQLPPLDLLHPITRVGNRLLDCTTRVRITIPAAPPRVSKVFQQWAEGWMCQCYEDAKDCVVIGSDGSYKIKGQGISAFVIHDKGIPVCSHSAMVVAHSSYDAEMHAANHAMEYMAQHHTGQVLFFIDNQSTLKSMFTTRPHSAFEIAKRNCQVIADWLRRSPDNAIEFQWMPSHIGFHINELADSLADEPIIGPRLPPVHNIASRIRLNRSLAVTEWRQEWRLFAGRKELVLKKKNKPILPHAWDGKGKQFIKLAGDIVTLSRFTRLISGHAPTGDYRERFFPAEPRGCTCFHTEQTRSHLLVECPKYFNKFSSMLSFNLANDNTVKVFKFLRDNPTAFTFDDEPIDIYDPP